MGSKLKIILELIIGIAIVSFILSEIRFQEVISILGNMNNLFWIPIILVYIFTFIITAYGLKALFDSILDIKFIRWLRYYLITFSFGLVLPGRTGEFSIIYFMKKNNISTGSTAAMVIIDKIITLIVFGLVTVFGLFTIINSIELQIGLLAVFIILLIGIFIFSSFGKRVLVWVLGRYSSRFIDFHDSYRNLLTFHKGKIAINFIVTILRPVLNGLLIVILFKALGYDVSLLYATIISSITLIASLAPLTPNGLGIREGLGLLLFNKLGIPFEASLSMYLLILFLNYLTGALGVIYYFYHRKD